MIKLALIAFLVSVAVCHWVYFTLLAFTNYGILMGILSLSVGVTVLAVVMAKAQEGIRK